ncbi:flavin reductase family protein [Leucobacter luti]|uniref:Flavin reductase (DIM6/NTAB) family NADH-FMN oxidoreductase RutF n=1 Tax=Leucobacter luti TaxID=340320 RepID=A0A4V2FNE6_9MICO|nr:flavin reductase family protein [Leucobacter luti]MBL3700267.1 flavin reductase [Leucobacter luti]RZT61009.1 flavin reductase (DIM6/NTAB) family NADH-FMN oxidoreductase RutF [Leucobacter luti]
MHRTTTPALAHTQPAEDLAAAFKDAFRTHPAGISLITAHTPDGPVGLTASSVASVGLDPIALAFSVTRATGSAGGLLAAESYVVHLLDRAHLELAQEFAVSGGDRFTEAQGWHTLPTGEPFLPDARAALRARTIQATPVGASTLVLAEVIEVRLGRASEPLVYRDRAFHGIAPLVEAAEYSATPALRAAPAAG